LKPDCLSARNLLLALAVALALGLVLWTATRTGPAPLPEPEVAQAQRRLPEPTVETPAVARSVIEVAADDSSPDPSTLEQVHGRVVDPAGAALPDLEIGVRSDDGEASSTAKSGPDGGFSLAADLPCLLVVVDPRWTTLRVGEVREDAPLEEALVVAAPAVVLAGVVVDRAERPLARARLWIRLDPAGLAALPLDPALGVSGAWTAASSSDGKFAFDRAPGVEGARLCTSLAGWRTDERALDLAAPDDLHIVLEPEEPAGPLLEGTVVHADGSPARGAHVSFGSATTETDSRGAFHLVCGWFEETTPLVAAARGFQPAVVAAYGSRLDPHARTLPTERLVLPGPALAIEGRLLGAGGDPCKGWRVALEDATELDPGGTLREVAEQEAGGRTEVRTDTDGSFRLEGLAARPYTLLAYGRNRLSHADIALRSEPIQAGSRGVILRAPDGLAVEPIRGRVLTLAGTPVPGVRLGLGRPAQPGSAAQFALQGRSRAVSGPDGRFEIGGAPAGLCFLVAASDALLPARIVLEPGARRTDLEIRVRQRRPLRFDGASASPHPDRVRALAAGGAPTAIWVLQDKIPVSAGIAPLVDGRSGPLAVGDEAREIAIYRGCVELGRVPIPAVSGESAVVVWP
jgi:hypothetical protein